MTTAAIADRATQILGSADSDRFQEAYDVMISETVTVDRDRISSPEIFSVIMNNIGEWEALSANDRDIIKTILTIHSAEGVPTSQGEPARTILVQKLGNNTKQELAERIPIEVPRWPGLTPGKVYDAIKGRVEGVI